MFADRPILEVRSDRPVDAMRLLDGMAQVEKTSIFGTAVHAVLTSNDALAPEVVRRGLAEAGMPNASIAVVTPTLEDVFLEVAGERR